jgi:hypothetical protein
MNRQFQFAIDADQRAAAAGAVELGDDEARQVERLVEHPRLLDGVRAERAVEHEPAVARRGRVVLLQDAPDFFQLLHQVVLGMQAARRVEDDEVLPALRGGLPGVEGDGGGIRARLAGNNFDAEPPGPGAQLLVGRRAESVACAEHDAVLFLLIIRGKLGGGRRLAGAVDADEADDLGFPGGGRELGRLFRAREHALEHGGAEPGGVLPAQGGVLFPGGLDLGQHFGRGLDAQVRAVEGRFELFDAPGVQRAREQPADFAEGGVERRRGALEAIGEFRKGGKRTGNDKGSGTRCKLICRGQEVDGGGV